jgi:ubiquinone/menaquinone biosynthesis C-methylase UbiE
LKLNDPERVRLQYETEAGLATRRDAQTRFRRGPDAFDTALAAVAEATPRRVLEVGCGRGQFAERVARETSAEVIATDLSPRMVELAASRGLDARLADVQALPFADGEFDCAVANAMLYHVSDLERALSELHRVLEARGRLVATTIGAEHMQDLWLCVGYQLPERQFSRETGEEALSRHFARVERRDVDGELVFPDAGAVQAYVDSTLFAEAVPRPLPDFESPFTSRTRVTVFVAER